MAIVDAVAATPEPSLDLLVPLGVVDLDGFPSLGHFDIGLMRKSGRSSSAVEALARHVTESLGNIAPGMMAAE